MLLAKSHHWILLAGCLAAGSSLRSAPPTALFGEAEERGRLIATPEDGERDIDECSGLVASRRHPGMIWAHDDSFKVAVWVLVFDDHAHFVRRFKIVNAPKGDFEDIALGSGPVAGADYIYLGDIGDNAAQLPVTRPHRRPPRQTIKVHRFREPATLEPGADVDLTGEVTTFTFAYPDGPHNAETLLMDPEGNLYVVIKEAPGKVYGVKRQILADYHGGVIRLEQVAVVNQQYVFTNRHLGKRTGFGDGRVYGLTGGDISPDGSMIVLKNMWESFIWFTRDEPTPENPWSRWAATLSPHGPLVEEPRESLMRVPPLVPETETPTNVGRGEAVAFAADGNGYYTAAEGKRTPLYFYAATTPAPTDLRVEAASGPRRTLTWTESSQRATGFLIERRSEGQSRFRPVAETAAQVTRYEWTEASSSGGPGEIRVRARTADGYSAFSKPIRIEP